MLNKSILQTNNEALSANNLDLQSLIDQANALPDAGGVELPELSNEGSASDLMNGKELIDGDGNKVTGTFSIDSELSAQDDLIAQIQAAVESLPEAGGGEPTLQNKTVTPTENVQTVTADSGYNGLDTVTVNAIPNTYVQPAATKEATFYVPGTTDLYILPGTYCKGKQTIRGDSNLIPSNIKSGVRIFNVSGTLQEGSAGVGDIELCTCNMQRNGLPEPSVITIYYITSEMTLANIMFQAGKSFSCVKNSIIYTDGWNMTPSLSGNVSQISYSMGKAAYYVNGDFTLIQT